VGRNKNNSRRRKYGRLSLDELGRIIQLSPTQKIVMLRYIKKKYGDRG